MPALSFQDRPISGGQVGHHDYPVISLKQNLNGCAGGARPGSAGAYGSLVRAGADEYV